MKERRGVHRVLVGKPERRSSSHTWEDNIKIDLKEVL
jgi:hypothetical protein